MSWKDNRRAISTIKALFQLLDSEQVVPSLCLKDTGLYAEDILNTEVTVSAEQELKVIQNALSLLPQSAGYGFKVGKELSYHNFGIWGLAILTSPNLRAALEALSSFSEMSIALSDTRYQENSNSVSFIPYMSHLPEVVHQFMFERYLFVTIEFLREMLPDFGLSDLELHLPDADKVYAKQLSTITGLNVFESKQRFAIVAPKILLDSPLPNADPIAHMHFVTECEGLLNSDKKSLDCTQKIRNYILSEKEFNPKLVDVAHYLMISERTLRRRLREEENCFQEIVLDTKMTLARELVLSAALPVKVVAARLDYSESASFLRAFKRWWGISPTEMRKKS